MKYYAVKSGRNTGIFTSWEECKKEVMGYSGAVYKSFLTEKEARDYLDIKSEVMDDLIEIPKDTAVAYVDGSYDAKNKSYGYGVCFLTCNDEEYFNGKGANPDYSSMRNVAGEISGSMLAVKEAINRNLDKIYIYYDYMGIEKWATGEWKANKEGTKDYRDFMIDARKKITILFKKVKAHSGDKYNEIADGLAKKALGIKNGK